MTELGWLVAGDDDNARRSEFERKTPDQQHDCNLYKCMFK